MAWQFVLAGLAAAANAAISYKGLEQARDQMKNKQAQLALENARYDQERAEEKEAQKKLDKQFSGGGESSFNSNFTRF